MRQAVVVEGTMSIRQPGSDRDVGPAAAPGMDGVWSARLRGQSPCAVPDGHSPLGDRREPQRLAAYSSAPLGRIEQTLVFDDGVTIRHAGDVIGDCAGAAGF